MKQLIATILTLTVALLSLASCSESRLEEMPKTEMTAENIYVNEAGFELGLNGLYSLVRCEREGYGFTDSFGATGLRALMYIGGTDNYTCGAGAAGEFSAIYKNWATANVPTDKSLASVFSWLYNVVLAANTVIRYADESEFEWHAGKREQVIAEARLIRAWAYRHLSYMWSPVPLVKVEVTGDTFRTDYTRESVSEVRDFIIEDLKYAVEYLPWLPSQTGRASKGVAYTYLSEIYLAQAGISGYDTALLQLAYDAADACITQGPYALITQRMKSGAGNAFMDQFAQDNVNIESGNTEALWVLQWDLTSVGGGENLMRFSLRPKFDTSERIASGVNLSYMDESRGGRGFARTATTKWAMELYDQSSDPAAGIRDERGDEFAIAKYYIIGALDEITAKGVNAKTGQLYQVGDTVFIGCSKVAEAGLRAKGCMDNFSGLKSGSSEGDSNNWPYTLKYNYCDPGFPKANESHNDQVFVRLAETYLLRAEAAFKLGQSGQAADDINALRNRAHALPVSAEEISLPLILEERSRELLGEEQRRYTLQRVFEPADFVAWITARNKKDAGMAERDYYFPIPQAVIDANLSIKMDQNPGF